MEAVGLLTRGKVTPGYYPTLTLISWGFLYFRLPVFDVPGDFVPGFIIPVPIEAPPVFFTNYTAAQLIGDVINQPDMLVGAPELELLPTSPSLFNDSSNENTLIPDDPADVQLLNKDDVGLVQNEDASILPNNPDSITLLPRTEPDLAD